LPRLRAGRLAVGLLGLAAILATASASAADRVISPTGAIHSIAVENRGNGNNDFNTQATAGTRLIYMMQSSEEAIQFMVIPGTDEAVVDSEPTILLSPLTYRPFIVWTRSESTSSEISYSFFNGLVWSPTATLTYNSAIDRRPQIFWGRTGYLHIVWSGVMTADGPLMYEAVLDSKGLVILPPGPITVSSSGVVTTTATAGPILSATDALFAVDTSFKNNPRVSVQGGLDEPVPVNRRVDFLLPSGSTVDSYRIGVVNGRLLLLVKSGVRMYYSYESPATGWTTLRSVPLDSTTDERAAEILITTMLEALAAP
jgi:hypothetical protein